MARKRDQVAVQRGSTAADPFTAAGGHFRSAMSTCHRTGPAFTVYPSRTPWDAVRGALVRGLAGVGFVALAVTVAALIRR